MDNQRKVIYFKTSNAQKAEEIRKQFQRYGVDVVYNKEHLSHMKINKSSEKRYFAVLEEHTKLIGKYGELKNEHLEPVINQSTIVFRVEKMGKYTGDDICIGSITKEVHGYLDFERIVPEDQKKDIFGFDHIFVVSNLDQSFFELKKKGLKLSARDYCISEFITRFLYRKSLGDWVHNPQKFSQPLELWRDPCGQVKIPMIMKEDFYGFTNLANYVLNSGIFFRASRNRRQNLYWCPGLNSGIPFVPKPKDHVHEKVFSVHDLVHHAIPDLVYTGKSKVTSEKVARFTYIAYRLMSEAITLVCADMFYVDQIIKTDIRYETVDARKIYPLFQSCEKHLLNMNKTERMTELLRANMRFCLLGDDSWYREHSSNGKAVDNYVEKYEKFFLQDFRWTEHNFDDMSERPNCFSEWWDNVISWCNDPCLLSIDEFIRLLSPSFSSMVENERVKEACDEIFNKILELHVTPAFSYSNPIEHFKHRFDKMFRKYMMAQCNIFFRFKTIISDFEINRYFQPINSRLQKKDLISIEQGQCIREFYLDFLFHLKSLSLLTDDDVETFKEVYPLFEPMILSYDNDKELNDVGQKHRAFVYRILDRNEKIKI